jgi:hypothetical protein
MKRLKEIAAVLEDAGYYVYIIKEQPDKLGESIIQKVLRYSRETHRIPPLRHVLDFFPLVNPVN